MRKPNLFGWALAALLCFLASSAGSQETGKPGDPSGARGRELSTLCNEFKKTSAPCDNYIKAYYGPRSDLVIGTLDAIDRQKDRARAQAAENKRWDRVMSGTLIALAFLTTLSAAVARTYRDEKEYGLRLRNVLGLLPIGVSALVALMASFDAYYKFDELRARHTLVADDLARLQTKINFELIRRVSEEKESLLTVEDVKLWQNELDEIMDPLTKTGQ